MATPATQKTSFNDQLKSLPIGDFSKMLNAQSNEALGGNQVSAKVLGKIVGIVEQRKSEFAATAEYTAAYANFEKALAMLAPAAAPASNTTTVANTSTVTSSKPAADKKPAAEAESKATKKAVAQTTSSSSNATSSPKPAASRSILTTRNVMSFVFVAGVVTAAILAPSSALADQSVETDYYVPFAKNGLIGSAAFVAGGFALSQVKKLCQKLCNRPAPQTATASNSATKTSQKQSGEETEAATIHPASMGSDAAPANLDPSIVHPAAASNWLSVSTTTSQKQSGEETEAATIHPASMGTDKVTASSDTSIVHPASSSFDPNAPSSSTTTSQKQPGETSKSEAKQKVLTSAEAQQKAIADELKAKAAKKTSFSFFNKKPVVAQAKTVAEDVTASIHPASMGPKSDVRSLDTSIVHPASSSFAPEKKPFFSFLKKDAAKPAAPKVETNTIVNTDGTIG